MPAGSEGVTGLYVWDPLTDTPGYRGLYGLAAFCHNQGGYYYYAEDGAYYWHACS